MFSRDYEHCVQNKILNTIKKTGVKYLFQFSNVIIAYDIFGYFGYILLNFIHKNPQFNNDKASF